MIRSALLIASKDLSLIFGKKSTGFVQAILLGLIIIFLFSLSLGVGERMTPQAAVAIFWMASCFCQVLVFNGLYSLEESQGQRLALLMAPIFPQAVWLGKALAALFLILIAQIIFLPAIIVFLGQTLSQHWHYGLAILILTDIGAASLGSLLGALSQGKSSRESLFSIIIFPLLIPIFLAGIKLGLVAFSPDAPLDAKSWLGLAAAFDAIFSSAALVLFPHIFSAES